MIHSNVHLSFFFYNVLYSILNTVVSLVSMVTVDVQLIFSLCLVAVTHQYYIMFFMLGWEQTDTLFTDSPSFKVELDWCALTARLGRSVGS